MHPRLSKNKSWFSHKSNGAGVSYELAISIWLNKLVWINGPFKASKNDQSIFKSALQQKLHPSKRVVLDNGYADKLQVQAKPDSQDSALLREFKSRARARHESFNGRIKNFNVLKHEFRHGLRKHKSCFEAVCIICQYQLENGSPLFDAVLPV